MKIFLVFLTQDRITKSTTKFQIRDLDFAWASGFQNIVTKICTMPQKLESLMFHRFRHNFVRKREILYLIYLKFKILGAKVSQNCDEFSLLE